MSTPMDRVEELFRSDQTLSKWRCVKRCSFGQIEGRPDWSDTKGVYGFHHSIEAKRAWDPIKKKKSSHVTLGIADPGGYGAAYIQVTRREFEKRKREEREARRR